MPDTDDDAAAAARFDWAVITSGVAGGVRLEEPLRDNDGALPPPPNEPKLDDGDARKEGPSTG